MSTNITQEQKRKLDIPTPKKIKNVKKKKKQKNEKKKKKIKKKKEKRKKRNFVRYGINPTISRTYFARMSTLHYIDFGEKYHAHVIGRESFQNYIMEYSYQYPYDILFLIYQNEIAVCKY